MQSMRNYAALFAAALILFIALETVIFTSVESRYLMKVIRYHVLVILATIHFVAVRIMWRRLSHLVRMIPLTPLTLVVKAAIFVFFSLSQVCFFLGFTVSSTEPYLVVLMSTSSFGIVIFLGSSMLALNFISFVLRHTVLRSCGKAGTQRSLANLLTALSLVATVILTVVGFVCASSAVIERVTVPIQGLDPHWNGTTIVQVSDIHLGPSVGRSRLSEVVRQVNVLGVDLVAITGDLVDGSVENLREAVAPLAALRSKYGVFFSTGTCTVEWKKFGDYCRCPTKLRRNLNDRTLSTVKNVTFLYSIFVGGLE